MQWTPVSFDLTRSELYALDGALHYYIQRLYRNGEIPTSSVSVNLRERVKDALAGQQEG